MLENELRCGVCSELIVFVSYIGNSNLELIENNFCYHANRPQR